MNIKKVYKLLTDLGVTTNITDTSIEEAAGQGENIYRLRKKENAWEFLFVQYEKSDGKEELLATFHDENTALKFYFYYELSSFFFRNYIRPFKRDNKDIFKGIRNFTLNKLKEAFRRLDIPSEYYSLDGTIKNHSFVLQKTNEEEGKGMFINNNGITLRESMVLKNWEVYNYMYQSVYKLYLLDQYYEELIENGEIQHELTDEDYKMFLSPASYYIINQ